MRIIASDQTAPSSQSALPVQLTDLPAKLTARSVDTAVNAVRTDITGRHHA